MSVRVCHECGVPRRITREHTWLDNGIIVETKNPDRRMLFFESENIVDLFRNIQEIIGIDIGRIIIESQRRSTYDYVVSLVPPLVRKIAGKVGLKMLAKNLIGLTRLMGYGDASLTSIKRKGGEDDHVAVTIRNPWFLESFCGLLSGGMEAVTGLESDASYEEVTPDTYLITTHISSHPMELAERLQPRVYQRKEGNLELRRCSSCGGPKDLQEFEWNIDEGTILTRSNHRRMVFMGPEEFEPLFDELENELGKHIPEVVIEAQRRFVTEGFYSREDIRQEADFRRHFALRGLGNLREIELGRESLHAHLENPCMDLVVVGLLLGFYELVFQHKGKVEWEVNPAGDLVVEVSS
jgi:ribosomal protein L37E